MNQRVYRASPVFLWISIISSITAFFFVVDFVFGLVEKLPSELDSIWLRLDLTTLLGAIFCVTLAIVCGMTRRNTSLTVSAVGIEAQDLRGRVFFSVKWPEIVELEQSPNRPDSPQWRIIAKGKRLEIDGRYECHKEVASEIYRHAPHLRP